MLSDEQQRLLHAWVDGECTAAEAEIAADLLSRPEATEYVSELKRLRELVAKHAGISAPAGLLDRVREAMRRDARSRSLFQISAWRTAGLAAAAAVVIAAGIVLAPLLNKPEPVQQIADRPVKAHEVANADNAEVVEDASQPILDTIVEDTVTDLERDANLRPTPPAVQAIPPNKRARNVLRLDRGVEQPLEISVQMNRENAARNLQVYNELLMVSSLYGEAELQDGAVSETITGRDFTEFNGVSVEVEPDRVPELIAALDRLAADQAYGRVVVPNDLRESIATSSSEVNELHGIKLEEGLQDDAEKARRSWGARHFLPPEVQRECLESELKDSPEAMKRLSALAPNHAGKSGLAGRPMGGAGSPKVRLILRLR